MPVDDIEEFHAKLEQIGPDRTKGTMITHSRYQESTIEYATAKGIGLTHLIDGNKIRVEPRPGLYDRVPRSPICPRILAHDIKDVIHLSVLLFLCLKSLIATSLDLRLLSKNAILDSLIT